MSKTKVSQITYIACMVKRPRKLNEEFGELFSVELKDYWKKFVGFQVDKFEEDVCPLNEVRDIHGDRANEVIALLTLSDLEEDKSIKEDVSWD